MTICHFECSRLSKNIVLWHSWVLPSGDPWSWFLVKPRSPALQNTPLTGVTRVSALPRPWGVSGLISLNFLAAFASEDHSILKFFFWLLNYSASPLVSLVRSFPFQRSKWWGTTKGSVFRHFYHCAVTSVSTHIKTTYVRWFLGVTALSLTFFLTQKWLTNPFGNKKAYKV